MEIVVRTVVMFFFLWILTRSMGKRELAQLSVFELLLLVTIGDLVQQGVTQEDYSVTGGILAAGTIALLILTSSYVAFRWKRARTVLEGLPVVVVRNGRALTDALHVERLTLDDLVNAARQQGIEDLSQVRLSVLEPDGRFSFLGGPKPEPKQPREVET